MKMKFKDGTIINTKEGVNNNYFLGARALATIASDAKETFETHGYNLNDVPGDFLKMFTVNARELSFIKNSLILIDEMGLKDIFQANLSYIVFTKEFVERVKNCHDNNQPFLNPDNTFASFLYPGQKSETQVLPNSTPEVSEPAPSPSPTSPNNFDVEDESIKRELVNILEEYKKTCDDGMLKYIIDNIIETIPEVVASDNKEYHTKGIHHLIENAILNCPIAVPDNNASEILALFPEENIERGLAA